MKVPLFLFYFLHYIPFFYEDQDGDVSPCFFHAREQEEEEEEEEAVREK